MIKDLSLKAMRIESEQKVLKQLSDLRKQLTTQTNNNILQKHGLMEEIVEFQKPITDTLKENNLLLLLLAAPLRVGTADISAQKIWQCFMLDALPDATY